MKNCLRDDIKRKIDEHPCYSKDAQHKFGRLHLAVAPKCNILCNYCDRRFDCVNESRPGVTSEVLTPEQALEKTKEIIKEHPFIKIVGIAGPGDPLANDETFETFRLIRENLPDLTLCMSTNGLMLSDRFDELMEVGVETLTVTINAIDPDIQMQITDRVIYKQKHYRGREAAELLIEKQLEGVEKAVKAGLAVKVNTVMIPGINDKHIPELAKKLSEMGVFIMNIMPLISQAKFADIKPPTDEERAALQEICKPYVQQMKHCRQCRSDAYGLIGNDLSQLSCKRRNDLKEKSKNKNRKDLPFRKDLPLAD